MPERESGHGRVLVVGGGPAGLVGGITLARYGIRVLLVEKRDEIATLSRALIISTRSMEVIRSWGLEGAVRAGAADVEPCGWRTHTLASREGTVIPLGHPTTAEAAVVSPTRPACTPQDYLEPVLLAYLRTFPTAEVRMGTELVDLKQSVDGVRALVRDRRSQHIQEIEALYAIGADGAHSTVRHKLGIRMDGSDSLGDYQRIEFQAPLAGIVGEHCYLLNIITHPDASGALTPRGLHDRWGFSREVPSGQQGLVDFSNDQLVQLLATATGVPDLRPRVERRSIFSFAAQLAERYRDRRVFLAGDAAHRTTPRGGTGMNTGIHDAYDLGWKLAWVLQGWAGIDLLDSYENERRPVGMHNVSRSADPGGARRDASDALPWDLNGRLAHHWVRREGEPVSTLDLLSQGLTVLAHPAEQGWIAATASLQTQAPITAHIVDEPVADSLEIPCGGAILVRPDGRQMLEWTRLDPPDLSRRLPRELRKHHIV